MNEKDILRQVANVATNREIDIEIDIVKPSILDRLRKRKSKVFKVRRSCLSTLLYLSELILELKTEIDTSEKNNVAKILKAFGDDAALTVKIIGVLILNTNQLPPYCLTKFLLKNLDAVEQKYLLYKLIDHNRLEDFLSSIILMKGMSLLKTEEMIASENEVLGKLSEEQ
ncbi:hypothetical protein [Pedobacter nototheniae]|uniref:hypothetical protein n=1 Tax=Pedobacter nototheniae TaxID=2488994 RepID=UPI001039EF42|nr:hypothetical protein [Pedobacter nototheniae]